MRRLLPGPVLDPMDDEALAEAYAVPEGLPSHLRVNFVTSADGGVSVAGRSGGLSSPADKRTFALLRDLADVVIAGAETVRVEGYGPQRYGSERRARRRRLGRAEASPIAIVSTSLDFDLGSPLFAEADPEARTMVITHRSAPADRLAALADVAHVLLAGDDRVELTAAVRALAERGFTRVLCEGGPRLFGSLLEADLVDELCLTVSPLLAGPGAGRIVAGPILPDAPHPLILRHVLEEDGVLLLRYATAGR